MFLCRVVSPLQRKIVLQTAEPLELLCLQLGPSFQARRNRQLYSYHQQMSLTTHLTLKCSDLYVHPPPQFRQISNSRAVTAPTLQHIQHEQFTPLKRGIQITIQLERQTDRNCSLVSQHTYTWVWGSNKFSRLNKKLPHRWVLRFLWQLTLEWLRHNHVPRCLPKASSAPVTRIDWLLLQKQQQ